MIYIPSGKITHDSQVPDSPIILIPFGHFSFSFHGKAIHGFTFVRGSEDLLSGVPGAVISSEVHGDIAEPVGLGPPRVIGRDFKSLNMHGILFTSFADTPGSLTGSFGQKPTKTFAMGNLLDQGQNGLVIPVG